MNKRPAYKRNDGNRYIKGDEWIIFDFEQKRWTLSEVFSAGTMNVFNETFQVPDIILQKYILYIYLNIYFYFIYIYIFYIYLK